MTKTKMSMWLTAAIAVGFAAGVGCGDPMPMVTSCTSDSQCAASEACHPLTKKCVPGCTSGSDCPSSAKTCATLGGSSGGDAGTTTRSFCQCATDALCAGATAGNVCDPTTKLCGAKCTADSACPTGYKCDTATGYCGGSTAMDAGVDAGVACVPGAASTCTGGSICDPATSKCGTAAACATANPQPDTCVYGLICGGTACAEAPVTGIGCMNFMNLMSPLAWNPATVTPHGPVTHSFASIAKDTGMPLFCGTRGADFSAEIKLYAGNTNFPAARDMLPANFLNYVRTDGQAIDVNNAAGPLVRATGGYANGLSNNNKNLTMKMNLCVSGTVPATISAGFYGENGNATCATLQ